ncbi:MAG: peptidoglycan-associated lipoprotein [Betaproteobacteria bacterium RBG_16_64_18]|nr:MAG: peptidoglycan-associated lipoprotein [Betaproteobacteria bacterium RBG_16_64_18]OGA09909.1 MAG: peptidoglycan-associated lipoprotein [Betaproteobacteria bacterium RIFCSPLOWO2_02_FULL_65_20]OGA42212.1 MAG: peptidoglycan-associated lipoprotein [Betaproteobacteria bacterium RIFCSPLOWO2_12_FULL_65_110]
MRKIWFAAVGLAVLYGCGSQPSKDEGKAGVEERTPAAAQPAPAQPQPPVSTQPVRPAQVQANPLKDPKNILSKRSVFFDYDSDRIRDEFRPLLQAHGKYLGDHAGAKMLVQGNADERGSREYNLALGQRRAEAIKRMLALMGARDAQIDAVSLGEEKPRCTEQSEACWAENRRGDLLHSGEF